MQFFEKNKIFAFHIVFHYFLKSLIHNEKLFNTILQIAIIISYMMNTETEVITSTENKTKLELINEEKCTSILDIFD